MQNQNEINNVANKFLGKQLKDYKTSYDKTLLVPIKRELNRLDYNISNKDFVGFDIWHNYECSFLLDNGYPLTLVGKIKIPCDSEFFIESKSMKLYFFSYHMEKLGRTKEEAIKNYKKRVINDLSEYTNSNVEFEVFEQLSDVELFDDKRFLFLNIENLIDYEKIEFNNFKENPNLIIKSKEYKDEYGARVYFKNVRSNCRVTHQPDFSNLFIHLKGELPTFESLAQYVISFRNEFHFHEEVTEQLYKVLVTKLNLKQISIHNLFTRRGGIDICPVRASSLELLDQNFINVNCLTNPTVYQ